MKKGNFTLSIIVFILIFGNVAKSQELNLYNNSRNKTIDIIDLFKLLSTDNPEHKNWENGAYEGSPIEWETDGLGMRRIIDNEYLYYRFGTAIITFQGEKINCLGTIVSPCKWNILLEGYKNGYIKYSISSICHENLYSDYFTQELDSLSKIDEASYYIIKKIDKYTSIYKLLIRGIEPLYIYFGRSCGAHCCSFTFKVYSDYELLLSDIQN